MIGSIGLLRRPVRILREKEEVRLVLQNSRFLSGIYRLDGPFPQSIEENSSLYIKNKFVHNM